ncbi:hypothetical protein ACTZWW_13425 [Salinarimonas sp. NSM]|uniref:hypothetical protein n=1 Tax=Salinarimonas sp. NSM TaxID=3458003 RepID=UPI0040369A2C
MSKVTIELKSRRSNPSGDGPLELSPRDVRSLYFVREPYVDQIVDTAVMLTEAERKLALRLIEAVLEHRRASLS